MLSAKKIAITTAISSEVEREKREEQKKAVEIEYDPQHPNSY
jgi:flagellar basal body rod protein FlgC